MRSPVREQSREIHVRLFKDGGTRADHLEVELTDIDYIDVSF
ncbi:hypothetical protein [Streptomyces sp. NBC_00207]|nr:hypothetical protein [Streptomyces sp. DSM 41633]